MAKGGAYCDLLAAAGEMSWSWSDEVNNSNEDNDDDNNYKGIQEEELKGNEALPPKKGYGRVFRESVSSNNDIAFFVQEFVTFDVSPRSIGDAISSGRQKMGDECSGSYDVLILEGAAPEILISVFLIQFC